MKVQLWVGAALLMLASCGSVSAKQDGGGSGSHDGASADTGGDSCTPGDVVCGTGMVNQCGQDGHWLTVESCALNCVAAPSPHCAYLEPKYLPDICDAPATVASFAVASGGTLMLDSDLDGTCTGGVVTQTGAANLCVVRATTISIAAGATLKVVSSKQNMSGGGRAIAFVADGALNLDGVLDVSADGVNSGPGGGTSVSGGQVSFPSGAGGAGFAQAGGAGGNATVDGGAANGGTATMNPGLLTALIGGPKAQGGGGGGAALLIACRGAVSVTGLIDAGGGGGLGGDNFVLGPGAAGFAGGAGGYVVLQGISVTVTGRAYANGGGGGSGGTGGTGTSVQNGQDGSRSENTAASGGTPHAGGGPGGAGGIAGAATANPGAGKHPPTSGYGAGGGGGSVGWFQTNTPVGMNATVTPSGSSPRFQPNGTVPTR